MAAVVGGIEYVVTGSAANLTTALGIPREFISTIAMRAGDANAGNVYFGKSNVTTGANRLGYLRPGEALDIDLINKFFSSGDFYVVGTPADILHILYFS